MDLELLKKGLTYTRNRRKLVYSLGALGATGYGVYKVYNLPLVVKKRQRLLKLSGAFVAVVEMVSDSAEVIGVVAKDLKEYLQYNTDQIPRSLKQISKITRSDEFSDSVTKITRAFTVGILRGYHRGTGKNGVNMSKNSGFSDRLLDKLFSEAGSGFVSVVVGSFTKNLVMAYYSKEQNNDGRPCLHQVQNVDGLESEYTPRWVDVLCEDRCRALIGDCIQTFVSTAVAIYLDKTMHINTYDEIFSGLTNPKHDIPVRDMLVSVCNGAVETFVRTSHNVLTNSDSGVDSNSSSSILPIDFGKKLNGGSKALIGQHLMSDTLKGMKKLDKNHGGSWLSKMSSTLAVSTNTRFVLDVTGRVTFETVRSFLKFLIEKISECMRRSVDVIQEEVVDAFRYVSRKSSTVVTICMSLCLHMIDSPWLLVPA